MLKKNILIMAMSIILPASVQLTNAQEKPVKVKGNTVMVKHEDIQDIMNKIVDDSTMRMQIIGKIMDNKYSRPDMMETMFSRVHKDSSFYTEMRYYLRTHSQITNMMQNMLNKIDLMKETGMTNKKDMMKGHRTMKYHMMSDSNMVIRKPD